MDVELILRIVRAINGVFDKIMNLKGKKAAVLGAGRSGRAAARLLKLHDASVTVFDAGGEIENWHEDMPLVTGATVSDGLKYNAELVVVSPGIETRSSFVESFCQNAEELIGETELACRFYNGDIIAITGTNGKTTTTALIEAILRKDGRNALACGNYGIPLSEILVNGSSPEIVAMEVSSFQMESVRLFHPKVAIWLNFAPDHMDRYKSVEEYYEAKLHIFDNQTESDLAVIRANEKLPALKSRVQTFSSTDKNADIFYENGLLYYQGKQVFSLQNTRLNHAHNAENAMAAVMACRFAGVSDEVIQDAVSGFHAPGHRCELVRILDGVEWYNDSKATNLHAVEAAIGSMDKYVILIAGGKNKGLDYSPLIPLIKEKVKKCVVFGEIADQLYSIFSKVVSTYQYNNLEECVTCAREQACSGDVVLFSPGTSSFDMYSGYEQRGQAFRDAVLLL